MNANLRGKEQDLRSDLQNAESAGISRVMSRTGRNGEHPTVRSAHMATIRDARAAVVELPVKAARNADATRRHQAWAGQPLVAVSA